MAGLGFAPGPFALSKYLFSGPVVLHQGQLRLPAFHLEALSGDIFDCHSWGDTAGTLWKEARDAAKRRRLQRMAATRSCPALNVTSEGWEAQGWASRSSLNAYSVWDGGLF